MMLHKTDPNNLKPCWHMRTFISCWIDGTLSGIAKWYTEWHVKQCPQCQSSVPFLRSLHERLHSLGSGETGDSAARQGLPELRWSRIQEAWDKVDAGEKTTPH